jgi:hypothetical protein
MRTKGWCRPTVVAMSEWRKVENSEGCVLHLGLELRKGAESQGGRTTREKCVRRHWKEREGSRNLA